MKLNSDDQQLAESKILLLYILSKVGKPISHNELLELATSIVDMNYFYFQQFLLDLIDSKFVVCFNKENQAVYEITELGKNTLSLTIDILPGIVKLKLDTNFKNLLKSSEDEYSITAEFTPRSENHYIVDCKIMEDNETTFEVKTFANSRKQAKDIVDNWKANASTIYPQILEILTKPSSEEEKK